MKSSQDIASYDNEFVDLQKQMRDIAATKFNGVSLFADLATDADGKVIAGRKTEFKDDMSRDNTVEIYTSSEGSTGTKISLYKSAVLSALTIDSSDLTAVNQSGAGKTGDVIGLFAKESGSVNETISLGSDGLSMGVFEQALSNIAYLRAQAGGGMTRLTFAADALSAMETNMRAAIGRIEDVDIAEESANLAKYSILTQASAAMVAQANTTNDVALMLLR
jgi:flagellin